MSSRKKKVLRFLWFLSLCLGVFFLSNYGFGMFICYHTGILLNSVADIIRYHDKYKDF